MIPSRYQGMLIYVWKKIVNMFDIYLDTKFLGLDVHVYTFNEPCKFSFVFKYHLVIK